VVARRVTGVCRRCRWHWVAEIAFFFAESRTFRLYLHRVGAGAAAAAFPAPFGRGKLVRARSCECTFRGAPARRVACRSLVVARTVCTEFRDPEGRRRTVFRVCSPCTRLSANSCGLELVVRRECARAVLTTVTNAGGPLVPWPRHVCVVEKLRGVPMFYRCLC